MKKYTDVIVSLTTYNFQIWKKRTLISIVQLPYTP